MDLVTCASHESDPACDVVVTAVRLAEGHIGRDPQDSHSHLDRGRYSMDGRDQARRPMTGDRDTVGHTRPPSSPRSSAAERAVWLHRPWPDVECRSPGAHAMRKPGPPGFPAPPTAPSRP